MSDLDRIVSVTVSTENTGIGQDNYGSMMFMSYHTVFNDLYRVYADQGEMEADGFTPAHSAYKAVAAAQAQDPHPTSYVIARHTTQPSYSNRLEVLSATQNDVISLKYILPTTGQEASVERVIPGSSSLGAEATALAALINDVDVDSIVASGFASSLSLQTLTGAALDGVVGGAAMTPGKRITFTFSSHADWDATTITVTGTDYNGAVQTEDFAVPNGGNATVIGLKVFRSVSSISVPAQSGTSGTATVGTIADVIATVASTKYVDLTPRTAGRPVHVHGLTKLGVEDNTADASYAASLSALQAVYDDWYEFDVDSCSYANLAAVAAWTEASSTPKLFKGRTQSTLEKAGGVSAPSAALKIYKRSSITVYDKTNDYGSMSDMAYEAASFPGSYTMNGRTLPGVSHSRLTTGVQLALEGNNLNFYSTVHKRGTLQHGTTCFGEFTYVVRGIDALISALQEAGAQVMWSLPKVPINKRGLLLIKTALDTAASAFFDSEDKPGLITAGTWNLTMPALTALLPADVRAGRVKGIKFSGNLAYAAHYLEVRGVLTAAAT